MKVVSTPLRTPTATIMPVYVGVATTPQTTTPPVYHVCNSTYKKFKKQDRSLCKFIHLEKTITFAISFRSFIFDFQLDLMTVATTTPIVTPSSKTVSVSMGNVNVP